MEEWMKNYLVPDKANVIGKIQKYGVPEFFKWRSVRKYMTDYQKQKLMSDYPLNIMVEVTNRCNAKCIMCPRTTMMTRGTGDMNYKFFCDWFDSLRVSPVYMTFHYSGEPLLNPDLVPMIEHAHKLGVKILRFNSNGILLNRRKAEEILDSHLDVINIAIEATEEIHNRLRPSSDYNKVRQNVLDMMALKKSMHKKLPIIQVAMLITKDTTKEEIDEGTEAWKGKVDYIIYDTISTIGNQVKDYGVISPPKKSCSDIWTTCCVLWNGDVVPCCVDHNATMVMGNVKYQTLDSIWRSQKFEALRWMHEHDCVPENSLCGQCLKVA